MIDISSVNAIEAWIFLLSLMVGLGAMLLMYARSKRCAGLLTTDYDLEALKLRLGKYAQMIGHEDKIKLEVNTDGASRYMLTTGEHKILLGALKKIEAKNAVLTAINLFFLTVGAKIYYDLHADFTDLQRPLFLSALLLLFVQAIARVQGNGHLGQRHFNKLRGKAAQEGSAFLGNSMQKELMRDLLRKEVSFDFSYRVIVAAFFFSIFIFAIGPLGSLR